MKYFTHCEKPYASYEEVPLGWCRMRDLKDEKLKIVKVIDKLPIESVMMNLAFCISDGRLEVTVRTAEGIETVPFNRLYPLHYA